MNVIDIYVAKNVVGWGIRRVAQLLDFVSHQILFAKWDLGVVHDMNMLTFMCPKGWKDQLMHLPSMSLHTIQWFFKYNWLNDYIHDNYIIAVNTNANFVTSGLCLAYTATQLPVMLMETSLEG